MSWKLSGRVKEITHTPSGRILLPSEKLFLLVLADSCDEVTMGCKRKIEVLAKQCLCSERTVQRTIKSMGQAGMLSCKQVPGQAAEYTLLLEHSEPLFVSPRQIVTPTPMSQRGDTHVVEGVTPMSKSDGCILIEPKESLADNLPKEPVAMLPVWVPRQEWNEFVEMRKKIRAPLTESAKKRTLDDLWNLSLAGQDVGAVLAQSVQRSWRGVFEVKNGNGQAGPQTFGEIRTGRTQAAIRRVVRDSPAVDHDFHRALPTATNGACLDVLPDGVGALDAKPARGSLPGGRSDV